MSQVHNTLGGLLLMQQSKNISMIANSAVTEWSLLLQDAIGDQMILLQQTHYMHCQWEEKTPKTAPSPWNFVIAGGPSHGHRQHAHKIGKDRAWFRRHPGRQTDRPTCSSQYFATAAGGEVKIYLCHQVLNGQSQQITKKLTRANQQTIDICTFSAANTKAIMQMLSMPYSWGTERNCPSI